MISQYAEVSNRRNIVKDGGSEGEAKVLRVQGDPGNGGGAL
jgi:hypothetical protein